MREPVDNKKEDISGNLSDNVDLEQSSEDNRSVEFMTPPQSDDQGSANLNVEQLMLGDALQDLDEDAQEGLGRVKADLQMDIMQADEPMDNGATPAGTPGHEEKKVRHLSQKPKVQQSTNPEESKIPAYHPSESLAVSNEMKPPQRFDSDSDETNSLSEEVQTKLDIMYSVQAENSDQNDVRVLKFTNLFLPDTDKRRKQMEMYNRTIMLDMPDIEDEKGRKRKRDLKDKYKKMVANHTRQASYLPVNPFLEDFYYLEGYSRTGVAPSANKKLQAPPGYKPLFGSQKLDHNSALLEKISSQRHPMRRPLHAKSSSVHFTESARKEAQEAAAQRANDQESGKKDFALEACQINELRNSIIDPTKPKQTIEVEVADDQELGGLRKRLRQAKISLSSTLQKKLPQTKESKVEQQSFALLTQLNQFYGSQQNQTTSISQQPSVKAKGRLSKKVEVLPSAVDMYEIQVQEKFKLAGIPEKRIKYWGELKDCLSESQVSKDTALIKREECRLFQQNKAAYKQPIFAILAQNKNHQATDAPNTSQSQHGKDQQAKQMGPGASQIGANPMNRGNLPGNDPSKNPMENNPSGKPHMGHGAISSNKRRPPPLVVEKNDFDLVTNFDEYEKLKEQEQMYYRQRKKTVVTAESIMRHVRWKMGKLSDKDFYKQEFLEMRREEHLDDKTKQSHQRSIPVNRRGQNSANQHSVTSTDHTDTQPKDLESSKKLRTIPIDFEENLDLHFDRRRVEIQEQILRKKGEKELASQQKQNTTQTPAYEPMPVELKESEEHGGSDHNKDNSDNDSSSSDSDSDSDDAIQVQKQGAGHAMLPSIADELNHAECIKDLSFFKLNWENSDLATFHRPDIQSHFKQRAPSGKIIAQAVSARKEDKETRLNPHLYFKTRMKLSLNKGKFCIFEHIDQHPLFLNNFGMASRLKRYYYGDKQPSKKDFLNQKSENVANRHIGPYGNFLLKQPLEKLDLLGQVDRTKYNGLTLLENYMYNAPVFYHRMPSTNNDFFCSVIKQSSNSDSRIVIRSLNSFYTVGQIEPKREVYNPQSRHFTHFIKTQSKAYTTRLLQENKVMSFNDIRQFFPQIGSPILKKGLKEIEVEIDRNHECRLNANFELERHKDRMTPEMICQFESARHGQYRLERIGISEILSADKISYSTHKFCFEETDLILQRVAKLIESEVLQTPWNLSSNYIKIKQEQSMMMLEGQGDPSFGHGGYSFLKMPLKISADSIQGAKANRMNLNPAIQNPKAVTGTDADLRKLKKRQLYDILREVVGENELETRTRWEMVAMLRSFASQQMPSGQQMKSFYARGVRNTSKKQQEMYNKRANSTFRKQMDTLSEPNARDLHDLSEEEPDFTQLPNLPALGLEQIGKGFGTSLNMPKEKDRKHLVQTKRDPGKNAEDFTRDIYTLVHDESRKQIVEIETMPEIDKIEDIKDYLKLFLVIHPNALSPQNSNPSGINIGGVSSNAEFLYAMNGNGSKEWEKKLKEKLTNGEIKKKCEILCHKIRSVSTKEDLENAQEGEAADEEKQDGEKGYERVIFCADEKAIKKFRRCMTKNQQRTPRRTNRRNMARAQTRPLTDANLRLQAAKNNRQGQRSHARSGSRSITSSVKRFGTPGKQKGMKSTDRGEGSIYSQPMRDGKDSTKNKFGGTINLAQTSQRNLGLSGQKKQPKKRKQLIVTQAPQQPTLRFKITNNGFMAQPSASQPATTSEALDMLSSMPVASGQVMEPKPMSIVALPGTAQPMSQPTEFSQNQSMAPENQTATVVALNLSGADPLPLTQPINLHNQHLEQDAVMGDAQDEQDGSGVEDDSKSNNLVNNEEVSNVASDYEPEEVQAEEESSDFDYDLQNQNMMIEPDGINRSPSKKKSIGKSSALSKGRYSYGQHSFLSSQMSQLSLNKQKSLGKGRNRKKESAASKFKPHGFSNDDFEYQNLTANKSRRRQQQDGTQSLNNIFMEIIDKLISQEGSYLFHNQPTRQEVPNYRDLIRHPIALKDMKNKSKRLEYKSSADFISDVDLMVDNAVLFNGPANYIAQLARDLKTRAQALLDQRSGDIQTMECVIKMDGAGSI